jgi:hypothetical protein
MTQSLNALLGSPDHYLHSFEGEEAVFVPMDRAAYRRSIFLDRRISPAGPGGWRVPAGLLADAAPAALPCDWIFHIAHCGSTLLARALDELGAETDGRLVLREPFALRQLALGGDPALLGPTLALLARRYPGQGPVLIKANVPVNFLLPQIVAAQPAARAVFLYSELADYLLAILRSDQHRAWLRNVTAQLAKALAAPLPESDAERAALVWSAQLQRFAAALAVWPKARSLEAEAFFARPAETLVAAATLFGQSPDGVETLVAEPLFNTYSKNPAQAFDNAARLERRAAVEEQIAGEIELAERWIAGNATDAAAVVAAIRRRSF